MKEIRSLLEHLLSYIKIRQFNYSNHHHRFHVTTIHQHFSTNINNQ